MGAKVSRTDFTWTEQKEPHAERRKEILEKYPQIKKLFGHDPKFKWIVLALVTLQILSLFYIRNANWPTVLFLAYCFGGVINHALMLAVHEVCHGMAFGVGKPLANKMFGMFANMPIGVPMSISFRRYHLEHHRYQGDDILDTDIPTYLEAKLFCTTFGKFIWVVLQPFFYAFRPLAVNPKAPGMYELVNLFTQTAFDAFVWYFFGGKCLAYFLLGSLLAMGLHPVAGHFISEHYMFNEGFETYSYYGPLNYVTFNVGYHNEHHDFPAITFSRLPQVRLIAPEYYNALPCHYSWTKTLYDFIMDPAVGPYARIKRKALGLKT